MSGSVKKVFMVLIIVVACVLVGAFLLNILLPNVTKGMVNAVEGMIENATGIKMDFNGDGKGIGSNGVVDTGAQTGDDLTGAGVSGFTAGGGSGGGG